MSTDREYDEAVEGLAKYQSYKTKHAEELAELEKLKADAHANRQKAAEWIAETDRLREYHEAAEARRKRDHFAHIDHLTSGIRDARATLAELDATLPKAKAELIAANAAVEKVRGLRADLAQGRPPAASELARVLGPVGDLVVAFDLPWPWGGERFELRDMRPLTYITGPLFSGKSRLAQRLAETLPGAAFLGLDRLAENGAAARARLEADPALSARVDRTLAWLIEDGLIDQQLIGQIIHNEDFDGICSRHRMCPAGVCFQRWSQARRTARSCSVSTGFEM